MYDCFWAFPLVLQMIQSNWIMVVFKVCHAFESHICNKGKYINLVQSISLIPFVIVEWLNLKKENHGIGNNLK